MNWTFALAILLQVPPPPQALAPGTTYDPAIPTLEQVVGHDFREAITPPDAVVRYMEALHEAAPDRTRLIRYAESWEGRPLVVMVIGSAERMADLEAIKGDLSLLNDPRALSDADAEARAFLKKACEAWLFEGERTPPEGWQPEGGGFIPITRKPR